MTGVIKTWLNLRQQKDAHLKLMAEHLLKCADTIQELRYENIALRERGDALAFIYENNDWSMEMEDLVSMHVASWREFQGVFND